MEKYFLSLEMNLFFFGMFFYLPKLTVFFGNRQQFNARAGQKKTHVFFGEIAQSKSNARAHLKQRKKHSGLTAVCLSMAGLPGLGSRHKPRHIWECLHTQVWFYQTDAGTDKYTHAILNPLTAGAALIRVFIFY